MKVLITGMPRAGSTLLGQIIEELSRLRPKLNVLIMRTHGGIYKQKGKVNNDIIFATYRDLRDVICSQANSNGINEKTKSLSLEERVDITLNDPFFQRVIKEAIALRNNPIVNIIRYEDYLPNNIDKLSEDVFKILSKGLEVPNLNQEDFKSIAFKLSMEENKKIADSFEYFSDWDKSSMIHGNHITSSGKPGVWKGLLSDSYIKKISSQIDGWNLKIGYS